MNNTVAKVLNGGGPEVMRLFICLFALLFLVGKRAGSLFSLYWQGRAGNSHGSGRPWRRSGQCTLKAG